MLSSKDNVCLLSKITPILRTEAEGCITLPSKITGGKLVFTLDIFSSSVLEVFTSRSFLRSQLMISDAHSRSSKLELREVTGILIIICISSAYIC